VRTVPLLSQLHPARSAASVLVVRRAIIARPHRPVILSGLLACVAASIACGPSGPRERPAEIPIAEYKPDAPVLPGDAGAAPALGDSGPGVGGAAVEPIDAHKEDPPASAAKLDAKNGFAGASFGDARKTVRGLKETGHRGDHVTFRAAATSYAGVAIKDVSYTFVKSKLAIIGFGLKSLPDCKTVKDGLERELGGPQSTVREAQIWRGDKVGLRFATGTGGCSALVVSKDLASAADWAGLEP